MRNVGDTSSNQRILEQSMFDLFQLVFWIRFRSVTVRRNDPPFIEFQASLELRGNPGRSTALGLTKPRMPKIHFPRSKGFCAFNSEDEGSLMSIRQCRKRSLSCCSLTIDSIEATSRARTGGNN